MASVAAMASSSLTNNNATPSDQIRQMVNFILQEAHEKANEIRVKVNKREYIGNHHVLN
jgi:hypothetical protein